MRHAVWFVRLLFAAWMIPAGVNHFVPIFPQPMGSQPLSQELIVALLDSHLFDLVKAVELVAGLAVLFGFYTPLALIVCLPVSFCVFYWDAPLEGWGSRAALFGYATFLSNVLLCLAYYKSYKLMFTLKAAVAQRQQLVMGSRFVLGAWLAITAAMYLGMGNMPPASPEPLAAQLMTSLVNSNLLDVAMTIQLVTAVLIFAGYFTPAALCLLMPITTCALYWALILDHQPLNILLALAAFALNALLMLAYLPYYRDVLQKHALAVGEQGGETLNYEALFVRIKGATARAEYVPALVVVVAAILFFGFMVGGRTAHFCMLMLLYPAYVLLARRYQDMGRSNWKILVAIPAALSLLAFGVVLDYFSFGATVDGALPLAAGIVAFGYALDGCVGKTKTTGESYAKA